MIYWNHVVVDVHIMSYNSFWATVVLNFIQSSWFSCYSGQFHSMCCRCFCFICAAIHRDAMVFVKKLPTMLLRCVSFVPCSALLQPGSVSFIHSDFQFISAVLISPIPFHPLSISRTTAILFNVVHCCHFASKYLLFVVMMIIIRHSKLIANVFFSLNTY